MSLHSRVAFVSRIQMCIRDRLKTELMTALQPAFARISAQGIRYSALPGHTMEIAQALNEVLSLSLIHI